MNLRGDWVYILAGRYRGAIYLGLKADRYARIGLHRTRNG
jgi:predicted GIY-YIG superfamily endonuclease